MLNKEQSIEEKKIIQEYTERYGSLTSAEKSELIRLKARNEFLSFCVMVSNKEFKPYAVHKLVCNFVQEIADGNEEYKYTAISLPPRTGKSQIISKYLPAWQIGRNPKAKFILASHTLALSQDNVSAVLKVLQHPLYKKIFPELKLPSRGVSSRRFKTTMDGEVLANSPQVPVSGFDAGTMEYTDFPGIVILDDLLSTGESTAVLESAWKHTKVELLSRGLPNKAIISMGTRYHANDVTGRLIESMPDIWNIMNVPALCVDEENDPLGRKLGESFWEEKYPVKDLKIIRGTQGEDTFNTLYQGNPPGSKGNYILEDDMVLTGEAFQHQGVFFSIDTNFKGKNTSGSYNCVCIWRVLKDNSEIIQLVDVFYSKCDFYKLLQKLEALIRFHKPNCITIEGKANGDSLISMLEQEFPGINIYPYSPRTTKSARLQLAAPSIKRGKVLFYEHIHNFPDFKKQLLQFPYVQNDDFVDALSLGVNFFNEIIQSGKYIMGEGSGTGHNKYASFTQESILNPSLLRIGEQGVPARTGLADLGRVKKLF